MKKLADISFFESLGTQYRSDSVVFNDTTVVYNGVIGEFFHKLFSPAYRKKLARESDEFERIKTEERERKLAERREQARLKRQHIREFRLMDMGLDPIVDELFATDSFFANMDEWRLGRIKDRVHDSFRRIWKESSSLPSDDVFQKQIADICKVEALACEVEPPETGEFYLIEDMLEWYGGSYHLKTNDPYVSGVLDKIDLLKDMGNDPTLTSEARELASDYALEYEGEWEGLGEGWEDHYRGDEYDDDSDGEW